MERFVGAHIYDSLLLLGSRGNICGALWSSRTETPTQEAVGYAADDGHGEQYSYDRHDFVYHAKSSKVALVDVGGTTTEWVLNLNGCRTISRH
jgi:hypothetical protein